MFCLNDYEYRVTDYLGAYSYYIYIEQHQDKIIAENFLFVCGNSPNIISLLSHIDAITFFLVLFAINLASCNYIGRILLYYYYYILLLLLLIYTHIYKSWSSHLLI